MFYLATYHADCVNFQLVSRNVQLWHYYITTILRLSGLCPGQPGWAGTCRRNIHPFTPVVVINQPLSPSSIFYDPWHPPYSTYMPDSFFPQFFPQSISKFSLVWHRPLILRTFLHAIIVFFSQDMPIPSQSVLL